MNKPLFLVSAEENLGRLGCSRTCARRCRGYEPEKNRLIYRKTKASLPVAQSSESLDLFLMYPARPGSAAAGVRVPGPVRIAPDETTDTPSLGGNTLSVVSGADLGEIVVFPEYAENCYQIEG